MKLQTRIALIPIVTVSVLSLISFLVTNRVIGESFSSLEIEILNRQVARVDNSISNLIDEHALKIVDWAQWDNTYDFIESLNPSYIDETLNPLTVGALGFSSVMYFTPSFELRYAVTLNDAGEILQSSPELVTEVQNVLRSAKETSVKGITSLGKAPFLFASAPILPNSGGDASRGFLVATAKVNQTVFEQLRYITNLKLNFWDTESIQSVLEAHNAIGELESSKGALIKEVSKDLIYAYGAFNSLENKPLIIFRVEDGRKILSSGLRVRDFSIGVLIFSSLVAIWLLVRVINFSATKRIKQFSDQVTEITTSGTSSGRVLDGKAFALSLRVRTAGGVLVVFALMTVATVVLLNQYFLKGFEEVEANVMSDNLERATRALNGRLDKLQGKTIDWAQWDDSYQYVQDKNEDYSVANLGFDTLGTMNMRYVFYFNSARELVDGRKISVEEELVSPVDTETANAVSSVAEISGAKEPISGFLAVPEGVVLAASSPILDTNRELPSRGNMVFAAIVNKELESALANQTKLIIDFMAVTKEDVTKKSFLDRVSSNEIQGASIVKDVRQQPVLKVRVTSERPVYQRGLLAGKVLPSYFALGGLLCTIVTLLCVDRILLARIRQLGAEASEIQQIGQATKRVSAKGSDEIAGLANNINSMLMALQNTEIELAKARDEAERANAAKSAFIAKISHELRSPLHGMLGMLRIILKAEISEPVRENVGMVRDAANGLLYIINDILDFSKFASGSIELDKAEYVPSHLVRDVLNTVSSKVYEKERLELVGNISPEVPMALVGDSLRLKQIFVNLIGNSVKFTNEGHIELAARVEGDRVVFTVSDTGVGIPAERLGAIFDPFTQADDSVSRRYTGTGLGLTITKQLTEAMGGEISVESQVGKGTTFTISLPLEPASGEGVVSQESSSWKSEKFSLLSEEKYTRDVFKSIFSSVQKSIRMVVGAADTLLEESEVIFVDGQALEQELYFDVVKAEVAKGNAERIVVFLAPDQLPLRERLANLGITHFLAKPLLSTDIVRASQGDFGHSRLDDTGTAIDAELKKYKLNVLVAEDNQLNQIILKGLLEDNGFHVTCVDDGKQMLDALEGVINARANDEYNQSMFDIVVSDIQMPVMDGLSATSLLRKKEQELGLGRWGKLPVIALTANAFQEEHARLIKGGFDSVVTKPLEASELWKSIKKLVKSGRVPSREQALASQAIAEPLIEKRNGHVDVSSLKSIAEVCEKVQSLLSQIFENDNELSDDISRLHKEFQERNQSSALSNVSKEGFFWSVESLFERSGSNLPRLHLIANAFLKSHEEVVQALQSASDSEDTKALYRAAHMAKGVLLQIGCEAGGYQALQVELASKNGDLVQAQEATVELCRLIVQFARTLAVLYSSQINESARSGSQHL